MIKKMFIISFFIFLHVFSFTVQQPGINDLPSEFAPIVAPVGLPIQADGMPIEMQLALGAATVVGFCLCTGLGKSAPEDTVLIQYCVDHLRAQQQLSELKKLLGVHQDNLGSERNIILHIASGTDREKIIYLIKTGGK
jgi:hypothetical protein